jgi:WD40 repeat protein
MAYDPQTGSVAMIPISIYGSDSIVLAYSDGKKIQLPVLSGKIWPSIEWLPGLQRFFAYGVYETILLAPDGSLVYLPDETTQQIDERPAVSPDGQWLAFWNENSGVRLYDSSGKPVRAISVDDAQGTLAVAWQPDSSGFYMVGDDGKLYSVTLPEGEPGLVDSGLDSSVNNMLPDAPANLGWVQAGSKP